MPEQLDAAALEQIRQITQELARRQGLSADDAEEIGGHLEDKLLAYFRGEARITLEDALLLARAHFGDAAGVARQVSTKRYLPEPRWTRHHSIVKTAIATAICTLVVLPAALLLFGDPPRGSYHPMLNSMIVMYTGFGMLEAGVLLAARADLKSRWQRIIAGLFIAPALAVLVMALIGGIGAVNAHWDMATRGGYAMIALVVLACLFGHVMLMLLLSHPIQDGRVSNLPEQQPV
ncbi:MAG TPA: hypothetical protein VFW23_13040 [Tepidisphaeraceae bacterium]|nr:hypothetical protein [Tepidisphaeraceae bacterium]